MKKVVLLLNLLLLISFSTQACPVCEAQQPKLLKGITHGAGPGSNWDYAIVWFSVLIVLVTFYYTLKWIIKPGEKNSDHIKRSILN